MTASRVVQPEVSGGIRATATGNNDIEAGYLISRLHNLLRRAMDDKLRDLGLNTAHYVALRELGNETALSAAELARRAYVRPQAMAPLITALEQQGLIDRAPHRRHRRIIEIRLTSKGFEMLKECIQRCGTVEQQLLHGLESTQRAHLTQVLQTCLTNMDPPWYEPAPTAD